MTVITNYRAATRPHPEVCTLPLNPVTIELAFRNQEGNLVGSVELIQDWRR
jgi:hypothetical protein